MERLEKAAIILSLVEQLRENDNWCGETHLQKTIYFLQKMFDVPLEFDFIFYKHGPYSFELSDELSLLRADGILKLIPQLYPYGPSFCPAESSVKIKKKFASTITDYCKSIEDTAKKLSKFKVVDLERYATALYVIKEENVGSDKRAKRITELNSHIPEDKASEALSFIYNF